MLDNVQKKWKPNLVNHIVATDLNNLKAQAVCPSTAGTKISQLVYRMENTFHYPCKYRELITHVSAEV